MSINFNANQHSVQPQASDVEDRPSLERALPPELLARIVSYLSLEESQAVARTCTALQAVTIDEKVHSASWSVARFIDHIILHLDATQEEELIDRLHKEKQAFRSNACTGLKALNLKIERTEDRLTAILLVIAADRLEDIKRHAPIPKEMRAILTNACELKLKLNRALAKEPFFDKREAVGFLAQEVVAFSFYDSALCILNFMDEYSRSEEMKKIVRIFIQKDDLDLALDWAHRMPLSFDKFHVLKSVALKFIDVDNFDQALSLLTILTDVSQQPGFSGRVYMDDFYKSFSTRLVRVKGWQEAIDFVRAIDNQRVKENLLIELSRMRGEEGFWDEALEIALSITDEGLIWWALDPIIKMHVENGHVDRALELAQLIRNSGYTLLKDFYIGDIVRKLVEMGDLDRAIEIVWKIESQNNQATHLQNIVKRLVAEHKLDQALSLVNKMSDASYRLDVLLSIVKALAEAGEYDRADEIAKDIIDHHHKSLALKEIDNKRKESSKKG
jgi:tetratricopeptide (TPR) repeat protein